MVVALPGSFPRRRLLLGRRRDNRWDNRRVRWDTSVAAHAMTSPRIRTLEPNGPVKR